MPKHPAASPSPNLPRPNSSQPTELHPKPRKLSFQQLDAEIDKKAAPVKRDLAVLIPHLRAMRELLRDPGKRNDLPDAEALPTWTEWKESKRKKFGLAPRTIDLLLETGHTTSKTSGKNGTSATGTSGTSTGGRKRKPALLKPGDYRNWLRFVVAKVEKRASECHPEVVHWAGEAKEFIEAGELALREETKRAEPAASVLMLPPPGTKFLWHAEEWELEGPAPESVVPRVEL